MGAKKEDESGGGKGRGGKGREVGRCVRDGRRRL